MHGKKTSFVHVSPYAAKQYAGGIVGNMAVGAVFNGMNTGSIDALKANYVGGISGLSTGYLRANYAKCTVQSETYIGGIAGSGNVVTDCLSLTQITGAEQLGAILGKLPQDGQITGNHALKLTTNTNTSYGAGTVGSVIVMNNGYLAKLLPGHMYEMSAMVKVHAHYRITWF